MALLLDSVNTEQVIAGGNDSTNYKISEPLRHKQRTVFCRRLVPGKASWRRILVRQLSSQNFQINFTL